MPQATFRFYGPLNDFLPPERRQRSFCHTFTGRASVKDMVESLGVPHPEIDLLLVNGEPVGFEYIVRPGDRVSVYPRFTTIEVGDLSRVRPAPLPEARFVLDTHLGRLAAYLRLLGFDTLYRNNFDDPELARLSDEEGRILLTRDRGLLKRNAVRYGYCVRAKYPRRQVVEVLHHFDLFDRIVPFRRCVRCNGLVEPVAKAEIDHLLAADTRRYYHEFSRCTVCEQIYWKGSHYRRIQKLVEEIVATGARKSDC